LAPRKFVQFFVLIIDGHALLLVKHCRAAQKASLVRLYCPANETGEKADITLDQSGLSGLKLPEQERPSLVNTTKSKGRRVLYSLYR